MLTDSFIALGETGGLAAEMRGKTTADWLAELELGKVKKAGTFLDLSLFTEAEQVKRLQSLSDTDVTNSLASIPIGSGVGGLL